MRILIIEDEPELAHSILTYLSGMDFTCDWADDIETSLIKIASFEYDCVLLDLTLHDGNGINVLQHLRKQGKLEGVIIISAKETLESRIEGLREGADDYLTKPFHLAELAARIQALMRRKNFIGSNRLIFTNIEIDLLAKTVCVSGLLLDLTKKEWNLLIYLIGNKNRVLSKNSIAEHLSGEMADMLDNHDFVYAHIKNLKKKLGQAGAPDYIKTIYGLGYKWQA